MGESWLDQFPLPAHESISFSVEEPDAMGESWLDQFPLRARGARLVGRHGERFKLAGVNWYGASDAKHVVAGLDVRPLAEICRAVADMGFTVVRLPFSNQMLREQEVPRGAICYEQNPDLRGLTPLAVYDRVVDALGEAGVAVVINNHTTLGMWSGGVEANGLWFLQGSSEYTTERWIEDWLQMAERYRERPHVIGYDLRNEVRPTAVLSSGSSPNWGGGGERDWSVAAGECARALAATQAGIIIVERMCWPQTSLKDMLTPMPPWDAWGVPRDRFMLSLHTYSWSGPGFWSPKAFAGGGVAWVFLQAYDTMMSQELYGELREPQLIEQMDREWGFCLDQDLCPVWLSEFGADSNSEYDCQWFASMCRYLARKDADFAYWPLNVGPKPGGDGDESYGLLTNDWRPRWSDERLQALRRLMPCPEAFQRPKGPPRTPWGYHEEEEAAASRPLSMLPHPWCAPLPGPLVPWPESAAPGPGQLPPCKYLWSNIQGSDADPGQDVRVEVFSDNLQSLKQICIEGGYGGFALHGGKAYMRNASAEELRSRLQGGFPNTILWLVDEVRLCGRWVEDTQEGGEVAQEPRVREGPPSPLLSCCAGLPKAAGLLEEVEQVDAGLVGLREEASAFEEECQWQCLVKGHAGFELDGSRPGWARMLPWEDDLHPAAAGLELARLKPGQRRHLLQRTPVRVGLEAHAGQDCFPGCNARVLQGASLARCRELCLLEGFGGFAMWRGDAYFRTAAGPVLRQHLANAPETTFYILTATEEQVSLLSRLWSPSPLCTDEKVVALESLRMPLHYLDASDGEPGRGKVLATKAESPKAAAWAQWRILQRGDGKVNLESLRWRGHYLDASEGMMGRRWAYVAKGHPDDASAKWSMAELGQGIVSLESTRFEVHYLDASTGNVCLTEGSPKKPEPSALWRLVLLN